MIEEKTYWLNFLLILAVPLGMLGFGLGVYFLANWVEFKSFFVEMLVVWIPTLIFYGMVIAYVIKCIWNFLFDKKHIQNNTEEQNGKPNGTTEPRRTETEPTNS